MPQSTFDEIIEKYIEIKMLLHNTLTNLVNDCKVYMKGIDANYHYEGYNTFRTADMKSAE